VHGCQARTKRPILRARREKLCPAGFIDPWEGGSRTVQRSVPRGLCFPGAPGFFWVFWFFGFLGFLGFLGFRVQGSGLCSATCQRGAAAGIYLEWGAAALSWIYLEWGAASLAGMGGAASLSQRTNLSMNMQIVGTERKRSLCAGCTSLQTLWGSFVAGSTEMLTGRCAGM
jgi:hypothetical protein